MTIWECQRKAQKIGYNSATFYLVGCKGRLKCRWLDAFLGLFIPEGNDGFMMVKDIESFPDICCENLKQNEN